MPVPSGSGDPLPDLREEDAIKQIKALQAQAYALESLLQWRGHLVDPESPTVFRRG